MIQAIKTFPLEEEGEEEEEALLPAILAALVEAEVEAAPLDALDVAGNVLDAQADVQVVVEMYALQIVLGHAMAGVAKAALEDAILPALKTALLVIMEGAADVLIRAQKLLWQMAQLKILKILLLAIL